MSDVASDELAIRNLVAAVAQLADTGTVDDYVGLFTSDAVWEMPENPVVGVAASQRVGHEEIREGVIERRAAGLQGPGSNALHVISTARVRVDGNEASGHVYWQFYGDTVSAPVLRTMGQYHDTYRREDARWLLARRSVVIG